MRSLLDRKMIIDKNGEKLLSNDECHSDLSQTILLGDKELFKEFQESSETITEMFLLEQGYVYIDLDVENNLDARLVFLYYSKNMSLENRNTLFDLLNEDTRYEKVKELFNDRESRVVLSKIRNIDIITGDIYNQLYDKDKEIIDEEFNRNEASARKITPDLLHWNKKNNKELVKRLI